MKLRKIVIGVAISLFVLIFISVIISIYWPLSWNKLLGSTILNIIASLIGVSTGILIAIFIVERYLENQRRKAEAIERLVKYMRNKLCLASIQGGLDVLVGSIVHLSYFMLYGFAKWEILMNYHLDENTKAPENVHDFMPFIMSPVIGKYSFSEQSLAKIKNGFEEIPSKGIVISNKDVVFYFNYMKMTENRIRDFSFLFQPFIEDNFDFTRSLIDFSRSLKDSAIGNIFIREKTNDKEQSEQLFQLSENGLKILKSLGDQAIKLYQSIIVLSKISIK